MKVKVAQEDRRTVGLDEQEGEQGSIECVVGEEHESNERESNRLRNRAEERQPFVSERP